MMTAMAQSSSLAAKWEKDHMTKMKRQEPTATVTPTRGKVPKMVKSLQSGSFMASNHVVQVLKDCEAFIHDNPDLQWELGQTEDGVPALIKIMNRFEDDVSVQEWACAIVRDLCAVHDDNRVWVATQGGLQAVLVALLKYEKAMTVQVTALHALANLSMNETTKLLVPEFNGMEVLKTCMDAYKDNLAIQIQVCRVVSALAQVPANARALASLGLMQSVIQTMQQSHYKHQEEQHREENSETVEKSQDPAKKKNEPNSDINENSKTDDETLQYHACAAVWALTGESDWNRTQMEPILPYILVAMKNYVSNASLQAIACGALWNLTTHNLDNAQEIVEYDYEQGIRIIVHALKSHPDDPNVQEAACAVIKNLSMTVDNANVVGHAGAIVPVLNAMRQHESNQAVQDEACSALCNLAMVDDHKAPILNAGGIGMIVFAMRQALETKNDDRGSNKSREEVHKHACQALHSLALHNEQNKVSIAASGGIATILLAMEEYPENTALQVAAVNALLTLTEVHRNRSIVLSHGGVPIVEAALNNHPYDTYFEERVLKLLKILSET